MSCELTVVEKAKLARAALEKQFPGVKFSVRSEHNVRLCLPRFYIKWADGPTKGMVCLVENTLENAEPHCNVSCYRDESDELTRRVIAQVVEEQGIDRDPEDLFTLRKQGKLWGDPVLGTINEALSTTSTIAPLPLDAVGICYDYGCSDVLIAGGTTGHGLDNPYMIDDDRLRQEGPHEWIMRLADKGWFHDDYDAARRVATALFYHALGSDYDYRLVDAAVEGLTQRS